MIVPLLALALPTAALAQSEGPWEPINIETADGTTYAIQRATITREATTVTLRTQMRRREPSPSGLYRSTGRWRYDCAARTVELLDYVVYGIGGETLETFEVPVPETELVQPETAHDFILRAIC
jgi:hypothetical protein